MVSLARVALATLVGVVLLSAGVGEAVDRSAGDRDPANCVSATLSAYESSGSDDARRYEDLSTSAQRAFDRALAAENGTTAVDPDVAVEFSGALRRDGTRYRTQTFTSGCPLVAGVPPQYDVAFLPFLLVDRVASLLYLPGAVILLVVLGYRRLDDALRFD